MTAGILAYVRNGSIVTSNAGLAACPDYANNLVYIGYFGSTTGGGFAKFNGYTDDSDLLEHNVSQMAPLPAISPGAVAGQVVLSGGYLVTVATGSNYTAVYSIQASTLAYVAKFGTDHSITVGDPTKELNEPYMMASLTSGGQSYIVACEFATSMAHAGIDVMQVPVAVNKRLGLINEKNATCSAGPSGIAYVLGKPVFPGSTALGLYTATVSALTSVGTISPAQVDGTWTNFSAACGVALDKTDGNPIIMVATSDAVATKHYIVKLNAATAAVIWTCAVTNIDPSGDYYMNRANISAQTFYYLDGSTLRTINTSTGVATNATIGTLAVGGTANAGQISDDASTSLILRGSWSETTTHPTYLGTYMGTGAHHAISDNWMRFFPGGAPPPPVPTPPAPPFPIVSVSRAWTYTMDGHTFYVLDLGAEGTFVYDLDTQQWSNFQTNSTNWAMTNGCMFGNRVVAGDTATTDVWEMVPSAVFDSGSFAYEITHVSTGGISLRSRTPVSCAAFRISASFGQLDDVAGVNISLSYSDDQGQTWVTPDVIALTQGTYNQEIAWRSLGSFAAPGRIFQITDAGGVIRIDGADMLDNFDDEKPAGQG